MDSLRASPGSPGFRSPVPVSGFQSPLPRLYACPRRARSGLLSRCTSRSTSPTILEAALKSAASAAGLADADAFAPEVRTADPRHGDFQSNGVLGYAKARKLNPRATAERIVAALPAPVREHYEIAIAGPGFINFALKPATLLTWLRTYDSAEHLRAGAAARARHASQVERPHQQVGDAGTVVSPSANAAPRSRRSRTEARPSRRRWRPGTRFCSTYHASDATAETARLPGEPGTGRTMLPSASLMVSASSAGRESAA